MTHLTNITSNSCDPCEENQKQIKEYEQSNSFEEQEKLIENEDGSGGKSILWDKIKLKNGISITNYVASLFHYMFMPFIFVSVEILQPTLLQDKFGILPENSGTQNSNIIMIDVGVKLIFAPIFGILADRIGRKIVLFYGICVITVALFLIPFSTNLYPQYVLCRCLYAHGAICIAIIPLLADYVQDSTKGKASSFSVIMASGGAMLSAQLVAGFLVDKKASLKLAYWALAGGYFICSATYCALLKGGVPTFGEKSRMRRPGKSCTFLAKVGWKASQNPWILMGYLTNLLARNDSILLSMYLIIWTYDKQDKQDFDKANIQGHILAGVAYTSLFVFTIVYGLLMERISKFWSLLAMFLLTALGGFMMMFAQSPKDVYTYIVMVILGAGMSGLQTASQYLIQKYAFKNHRGYITGLSGIFSVLGILICVVSGYLVDSVSDVAPFTCVGIISFLSLLLLGYIYCRHRRYVAKWKQNQDCLEQELEDLNEAEKEDLVYQEQNLLPNSDLSDEKEQPLKA